MNDMNHLQIMIINNKFKILNIQQINHNHQLLENAFEICSRIFQREQFLGEMFPEGCPKMPLLEKAK